jgi:toxin ParE1/3/4
MSGRFVRSSQAEDDLIAIWSAIAPENRAAADRVLDRIEAACVMLASYTEAGPRRDDIVPGFRYFPVRPYLVFYRVIAPDLVEIVRVVDGRRDLAKLF